MTTRRTLHQRVLEARNTDELAAVYADWAASYDTDLTDEMGYIAPALAAERVDALLSDTTAQILDAGCGTGLVGQALHERGYRRLDGLDYSPAMLDKARAKGVYRTLSEGDLTKRLGLDSNGYAATTCVGTLTIGHVGPDALHELARVTQPGGYVVFTVREEAWQAHQYDGVLNQLQDQHAAELTEKSEVPYIEEDASSCFLCVLRVG